ncbi:Eco29kI family restriction endonuclease [Sphingomonas psychrotolerans]|uniref:Restriction endonuclease n=1 Tax=Sphingomonas psychrotolerans TaxID=1327635 RepID=A0A2K8MHR5_9SPHN|nr:Eco29kI family restriction endonuclease [Sphingomonas psychrotolerans]ATY32534.1 restriction endonuclease [Sphingomonas psychrotolerans]
MSAVYNPLDKINLGKSVAEALLDQPHHPLGNVPSFEGAGIYVIYYSGGFPAYAELARENAEEPRWPIYIGKAVPAGARRGASLSASATGRALYNRICDHRDSIIAAEAGDGGLAIADFRVRYLAVDDIWIPLGESLLISTFKPVWNRMLDGFGNHDPGAGRYNGLRPLWDLLHPGRGWADKCRVREESRDEVAELVRTFLVDNPAPRSSHMKFGR